MHDGSAHSVLDLIICVATLVIIILNLDHLIIYVIFIIANSYIYVHPPGAIALTNGLIPLRDPILTSYFLGFILYGAIVHLKLILLGKVKVVDSCTFDSFNLTHKQLKSEMVSCHCDRTHNLQHMVESPTTTGISEGLRENDIL